MLFLGAVGLKISSCVCSQIGDLLISTTNIVWKFGWSYLGDLMMKNWLGLASRLGQFGVTEINSETLIQFLLWNLSGSG